MRRRRKRHPLDAMREERLRKLAHLKLRFPLFFHAVLEEMKMSGEVVSPYGSIEARVFGWSKSRRADFSGKASSSGKKKERSVPQG